MWVSVHCQGVPYSQLCIHAKCLMKRDLCISAKHVGTFRKFPFSLYLVTYLLSKWLVIPFRLQFFYFSHLQRRGIYCLTAVIEPIFILFLHVQPISWCFFGKTDSTFYCESPCAAKRNTVCYFVKSTKAVFLISCSCICGLQSNRSKWNPCVKW